MFDYLTNTTQLYGEIILAALSSVLLALLIWSLKESYRRHDEEAKLLGKIEIIFAHNLGNLLINQSYFDSWCDAMREPRLYNCAYRTYIFFDNDDFKTTNGQLLNKLVTFNFSLQGLNADVNLLFSNYHKTSEMMLLKDLVTDWNSLNTNTLKQSEDYKVSFNQAIDDAKGCVALVRAYAEQKRRTPYGLVRIVLGKNILSKITEEALAKHREEIEIDLEKKGGGRIYIQIVFYVVLLLLNRANCPCTKI